ncbi:hypothetical protein GCM10017688_28170 [Streptomyces ramulosus]
MDMATSCHAPRTAPKRAEPPAATDERDRPPAAKRVWGPGKIPGPHTRRSMDRLPPVGRAAPGDTPRTPGRYAPTAR